MDNIRDNQVVVPSRVVAVDHPPPISISKIDISAEKKQINSKRKHNSTNMIKETLNQKLFP